MKISQKTKDKLHKLIEERLIKIVVYMETSMGFPHDLAFDKIDGMTDLEKLSFVNGFAKRHPKVIKPIHYNEIII